MKKLIFKTMFWTSLLIGIPGVLLSFTPGIMLIGFGLCTVLCIPATFLTQKGYRIAASIFLVIWFIYAVAGYFFDKEQKFDKKQEAAQSKLHQSVKM